MTSREYAVALSQHPDSKIAAGEVVGQCLERVGASPSLAVLFLAGSHAAAAPIIARTVRNTLKPRHLLGATASATLAQRQEVEDGPSVVLWVGRVGPVEPLRLNQPVLPPTIENGSIVLIADPFSFDASSLAASTPKEISLVGGLASAARRANGNHLLLDDDAFSDGAVAICLPSTVPTRTVVATGCLPIGNPMVVTDSQGSLLKSLAGQPAIKQLETILTTAEEGLAKRIQRSLHVGIVAEETSDAYRPGDFIVRNLIGVNHTDGSVAVNAEIDVGTTVQFQIRDATAATRDLKTRLGTLNAQSALLFTCTGRGSHLFGAPGHDAGMLVDELGTTAVAGMFCAGELGPVGTSHQLHGFTASALLIEPGSTGDADM